MGMAQTSDQLTRNRFDSAQVATGYAAKVSGSKRNAREERCIHQGLKDIPLGSLVLDLPCGTGRLLAGLLERGYKVVQADSSQHMINEAKKSWERLPDWEVGKVDFQVQNVMHTTFADRQFDAVICNRLFHHFVEPATRIAALRELGRIARGPIVVSFFNAFALDSISLWLRSWLRKPDQRDREPISMRRFRREAESAGLKVATAMPTSWGISPQWYVVLESAAGPHLSDNNPGSA
jgi:ubiquinone/menaquinone biosynthesis C-methylase UbiE